MRFLFGIGVYQQYGRVVARHRLSVITMPGSVAVFMYRGETAGLVIAEEPLLTLFVAQGLEQGGTQGSARRKPGPEQAVKKHSGENGCEK